MTATTAPIVLFVFARPEHTRRTLNALAANLLAKQSNLIIYSDAARDEAEMAHVQDVRDLVHAVSGFHTLTVIERETNYGLARNIIEGVTEVCNHYGRVIVLEDDIVTSPHFLSFMNAALDRYVKDARVWHISGWNYPIDPQGLGDAYFWRFMNCWGWGTWSDRWQYFEKDPKRLVSSWENEKIRRFNLDGSRNYWQQVTRNFEGRINTWAIFWYATIFEKNGLCLNPVLSYVRNIGHDGSGSHSSMNPLLLQQSISKEEIHLPDLIVESDQAIKKIIRWGNRSKSKNRIYRIFSMLKALRF